MKLNLFMMACFDCTMLELKIKLWSAIKYSFKQSWVTQLTKVRVEHAKSGGNMQNAKSGGKILECNQNLNTLGNTKHRRSDRGKKLNSPTLQ